MMGSTNILWHWQTTSMSGESFSPPDSDLMVARYGDIAESEHRYSANLSNGTSIFRFSLMSVACVKSSSRCSLSCQILTTNPVTYQYNSGQPWHRVQSAISRLHQRNQRQRLKSAPLMHRRQLCSLLQVRPLPSLAEAEGLASLSRLQSSRQEAMLLVSMFCPHQQKRNGSSFNLCEEVWSFRNV